ncbi:hypothetical protein SEA_MOLEFICENT_27 [Microbacterium phage Moleficent]|uniref:Uncharacterized protein n=5 Tax=Akonivirus TaxID=2842540 RepID=A0A6M3T433_9CAUD|nr:hypothetical protein HWD33_gp27 [Microbacterium phage Phedro]QJD52879.1 hypothetical protein SEA_PHRACTURED_27 [Microbacterium phage Phractured]QJD52989.1 hypothetical protein SEA_PHARKY_27 [Microbacterium phage Pharky]QWY82719.1 hypothetical protein SEA_STAGEPHRIGHT_27 [Microbacterium phage StagePhright]UXE04116.1 hypothetical protein Fullmetal_27 [Microbacterium phage Fullmetal]WNM74531.1 hypothetical protein SEA_MOLEFICENT_27 [Microbacterium phage Moleficent]
MADTLPDFMGRLQAIQVLIDDKERDRRNVEDYIKALQKMQREYLSAQLCIPEQKVFFGSLSCNNSPTRFCVFNLVADPKMEDCIYCHNDWTHG